MSVLSPALLATRFHFGTEIASSPTNGLSVSGVAAAVARQEDQALHPSLLPFTVIEIEPTATPTPLPRQSPLATAPDEGIVRAAGVGSDSAQPTPLPAQPVYIVYTVQEGDTLDALAAAYGISADSILGSNPLLADADTLVPGEYLRVPTSDGIVYDVESGDTLSGIADRFGVDVQSIIDFARNNLASADSIAEGQTIFVPNGTMPAPVATPPPVPEPESPSAPAAVPLPRPPAVSPSGIGEQAVELARSRIGAPYVSGAAGPNGFDCSGLVYWVYSQLGVAVPRSAAGQYAWATPVEMSQLEPGDLVFFANTSSSGGVSHVGIYAGGGGVVMAVDNGDIVREVALAEAYWTDHFAGGGRPP